MRNEEHGERRIFVSHATADGALAGALADVIRAAVPGVEVFVSSQPGSISVGEKWQEAIEQKLITASAYIVLLTPASVERHWVWFEAGSIWFLKRKIVMVCAAGLRPAEIPAPLSSRQTLSLDSSADVKELFRTIGASCDDAAAVVQHLLTVAAAQTAIPHVVADDRTFVWSGPLSKFEDWEPVEPPTGLADVLEANGLKARDEPSETIVLMFEEGWMQLYESDCRRWKRAVRGPQLPRQRFLVKPIG
jgi:hypothetical protein